MSRPAYQRGRQGGRPGQWVAVADLGFQAGKRDRREFTAATKREAEAKRDAFLHKREAGFLTPKGRALYVSEWAEHWLHNVARGQVEATTWHRSYKPAVEDYVLPFFSRVTLDQLREEDIQSWHAWLSRRESRTGGRLSAATIGRAHRILGAALKEAVVRDRLARNPCSNVSPPKAGHVERAWPSAAECAMILDRCRTWPGGARWVLAITTGLRQSEALALCWRDVRLDGAGPSVTVRRARTRVDGEWVTKAPKSAKGRRLVPLPPQAVAALRAHRAAQTVASLDGLVFTTARGLPVHGSPDRRDFARLLEDLGLPHYRVHDLRHAYGSLLLARGVDVRVVQELMGHSSASVTQNIYQHVTEGLKMGTAASIDQALGGD